MGAPVTATVTENLLVVGPRPRSSSADTGFQRSIPTNDAVLPTRAIRSKAVSYHHLLSEEVEATPELVDALASSLSV